MTLSVPAKSGVITPGLTKLDDEFSKPIGRLTAKAARHGAQQIQIHGAPRALKGGASIRQILWAAREALHGDEVFSTDDAQIDAVKGYFDGSRKDLRVETAKTAQKLHPIAMGIAHDEHA